MAFWGGDSKISMAMWSCDETVSDAFDMFCSLLFLWYWPDIAKDVICRTTPVVMHDEKVFLFENIVGAEYIVCTHWLNIVGAAAPIAALVPILRLWCHTCTIYGQIPYLRRHVTKTRILVNKWRIYDVTVSYDILAWSSRWCESIAPSVKFHVSVTHVTFSIE